MKFNVVIEPESSCLERMSITIIVIFTFVPFAIGLVIQNLYLCLSFPLGIFFIFLFNILTKGKFKTKNWIQDSSLEFDVKFLTYKSSSTFIKYKWEDIQDFKIKVTSYYGQVKNTSYSGGTKHTNKFQGTENLVKFTYGGKTIKYKFHIGGKQLKKELIQLFCDGLGRPYITQGHIEIFINQSIRYRTYMISNIDRSSIDLID